VDGSEDRPRRKRGAQPGNQNAFKHGFYGRYFENLEAGDLDAILTDGLQDEIAMMRVITRRVMKLSRGVENLDEAITILGALGIAASRLAGLLKTQKILGGEQTEDVAVAISQALSDVIKELGIQ
jgi:hypothetical protein